MKEFDSILELNTFNEKIFDSINEYLSESNVDLENDILAINNKTLDIQICNSENVVESWDYYKIKSLIRDNEDGTGIEPDNDETWLIANKYIFVR